MQMVSIEGSTGSSHRITLSNGEVIALEGEEPKSTDLVLAGLAACSARSLEMVMRRMRVSCESVALSISARRAEQPPQVFTRIEMNWLLSSGEEHSKLRRALELAEKHCTVLNILRQSTPIHATLRIEGDGTDGQPSQIGENLV